MISGARQKRCSADSNAAMATRTRTRYATTPRSERRKPCNSAPNQSPGFLAASSARAMARGLDA
eukprot:6354247-Lingulodinium_polyedra.AAC.1